MNLKETIQELGVRAAEMELPDLRRLIENLRPQPEEVEPFVQFADNKYARNLVNRSDQFEVLVLCWKAGQRSPVHDHANSLCSVYVYEGIMSADNYVRTPAGHVRPDYSEEGTPGTVISIQKEEIHQMSNLDADRNLVSVHFYLAPLKNYHIYSLTSSEFESYSPDYTRVYSFGGGI